MWNWWVRHWRDMKGNAKWDLVKWVCVTVFGLGVTLLRKIPWHDWAGFIFIIIGLAGIVIAVARSRQSRRGVGSPSTSQFGLTHMIDFDHLPRNMLDSGWVRAYPKDAAIKPQATLEPNAPVPGSVMITAPAGHAYDYLVPQNAIPSTRMTFTTKYGHETMIFVYLALRSKDERERCRKWIKLLIGPDQTYPTPGYEDKECTVVLSGTLVANGWRRLDLNLPDLVRKTWGKQGLLFEGLTVLRLRSSLQISPICFYEH
jgi:hypothetical protein